MTNNFEHDEHEHGDEFVEHEIGASEDNAGHAGAIGNLAEAWRSRPMFKFLVLIVGVVGIGIAAFSVMGGNAHDDVSRLSALPNMKEAPGGAVSPYMRQQTELANKQRSEEAAANGGSAMPTPVGQSTDVTGLGGNEKKDDALNELRAETERLKQQVQQQQVQQAQQQQQIQQQQHPPEQFDNSLAEAMQRQMGQLLDGWTPKGMKQVAGLGSVESRGVGEKSSGASDGLAATPISSASSATTTAATQRKILVPAGTVSYAQMLTEANSDVPGPILAQIVSGPLAGSRAVGAFKVSDGYEKYLVLEFTIADKKGKDYQLNAIALDPDTTLGGMATEVDERYFVRVVLPAAAGFLQGMGQALGQGSSSVTTNGTTSISTTTGNGFKQGIYNGLGQGAQTMGQFFQNQANLTKPLVRVAAGTPMGIFFVSPVYDTDVAANPVTQANTGNTYPSMNGAYPGTNVNGYGNTNGNNANGAAGSPYPNYAVPGYGYSNSSVMHSPNTISTGGMSQTYGYGQ